MSAVHRIAQASVLRGAIWLDRRLREASVCFVRESSGHLVERRRTWVPELPIGDEGEFYRLGAAPSRHPGKQGGQCALHAVQEPSSGFARDSGMTTTRGDCLRAHEIPCSCTGYGAVAADEARDERCRRASHFSACSGCAGRARPGRHAMPTRRRATRTRLADPSALCPTSLWQCDFHIFSIAGHGHNVFPAGARFRVAATFTSCGQFKGNC